MTSLRELYAAADRAPPGLILITSPPAQTVQAFDLL
jgi:hypothetical protein